MKKIIVFAAAAFFVSTACIAQKNRVPAKRPKTQLKIADKFYA
jgi:hypothetical protein